MEVARLIVLMFLAWPAAAGAQPAPAARPFEIVDNSFLVEEAYNQESKIFQNIFGALRSDTGDWAASFTQEWPAPGMRHQLSYTLVFNNEKGRGDFGSVAINYRFQLRAGEDGGLALAPRVSLLLRRDRVDSPDAGRVGVELNLPASRQLGEFALHGNAGVRIYPAVESSDSPSPVGLREPQDVTLATPFLAGSIIRRVRPMLYLMLESVILFPDRVVRRAVTSRETAVILSPGTRFGWNIGAQQLVLGVAVPFERDSGQTSTGLFGYASWELPFRR